jgi:hypothetical protein
MTLYVVVDKFQLKHTKKLKERYFISRPNKAELYKLLKELFLR